MGIIWTVLTGLVVGMLATALMAGRDPSGFFINAAIGIAGSLLARYGGEALGLYQADQPAGFVGSLIGAIVLLVVVYQVAMRKATT